MARKGKTVEPSSRKKKEDNGRVLEPDTNLRFPHFILLKASAGTGKTHALTLRFIQFLLSPVIAKRTKADLKNILAITFTRNAAKEMKSRVLDWLKKCYFGDPQSLDQVSQVVNLPREEIRQVARLKIEEILSRYADFQVETIDSFMATIFRSSAIDIGYPPDFEIVFETAPYLEYAFSRFLRQVSQDSSEAQLLLQVMEDIGSMTSDTSAFLWDPTQTMLRHLNDLYGKLEAFNRQPVRQGMKKELLGLQEKIKDKVLTLERLIADSGCLPNLKSSFYKTILHEVKRGNFNSLKDARFKTPPIKKDGRPAAAEILKEWAELADLVGEYAWLYAFSFFQPHLSVYQRVMELLEQHKKEQGIVFIEDLNKAVANYIHEGIVPDIYFRLGEKIYHYLIDEFQDTSPLQWANLRPLIENSLAEQGSLFIVGDTKQAIYGFREADYRIMKGLESGQEIFPSAPVEVRSLKRNYRSQPEILDFVTRIFPLNKSTRGGSLVGVPEEYFRIATESGLDDFECEPFPRGEDRQPGYVGLEILADPRSAPPPADGDLADQKDSASSSSGEAVSQENDEPPEKVRLINLIQELLARGYSPSEMAILTYRNNTVTEVASWLNEYKLPFIPFSSLDIRLRPCIREILALLRFLDFPPDNLSFATFLLGEILAKKLAKDNRSLPPEELPSFIHRVNQEKKSPLYTVFRARYPELWSTYFDSIYRQVGFSPLYDLVCETYRVFDVLTMFPKEEASLVKLLEVIKEFEGQGKNNLREFLEYTRTSEEQAPGWAIDVAEEVEAIRVMSIHKAKGLGFPVVIVLMYPERFLPHPFYIDQSEGEGRECYVLRITQGWAEKNDELRRIYEEAKIRESVNRLNTFYVALTRARQELYFIGVKKKYGGRYPFDLLESLPDLQAGQLLGPAKPQVKKAAPPRPGEEVTLLRWPVAPSLQVVERAEFHPEALRRGKFLHEVLAEVEWVSADPQAAVQQALARLNYPPEKLSPLEQEIVERLPAWLSTPPLQEYFLPRPDRRVWREKEVCDEEGHLFRLDRVVVDPERVVVIDFKSGAGQSEPPAARGTVKRQMAKYLSLVGQLFPEKKAEALVVYFDDGFWEVYR